MEYVPPRSKPRMIPMQRVPNGDQGYVLKRVLEPMQVNLMRETKDAGVTSTDTPATMPIRYAKPM